MARSTMADRTTSTKTNSILYNGDFETRPSSFTASTNTAGRWIDGTAAGSTAQRAFGWAIPPAAVGNAEAHFETSIKRSGSASMALSNLTAAGFITVSSYRQVPSATLLGEVFVLQPSTQYVLRGYIRTNNVPTNGAFMDIREFGATATTIATTSTNKLSGTDATFREVTVTVTTNSSTRFGALFLRLNVTGNICDAYFDDITLIPATTGRVAATGRVAS